MVSKRVVHAFHGGLLDTSVSNAVQESNGGTIPRDFRVQSKSTFFKQGNMKQNNCILEVEQSPFIGF